MKNCKRIAIAIVALLTIAIPVTNAQTSGAPATNVRIAMRDIYGELFVTIAGTEKKVSDQAQQAWIINGGRQVVYSSNDGAGGFENEGQSLHLYDVATGNHRRLMSEYFMIDIVKEVVTRSRKRALLVTMADGGLGASYLAVVDPLRGEVFFRRWVRLLSSKGDTIVLGYYRERDWDELLSGKKVRPYKRESYNLNSLLRRRVIVNKKEDRVLAEPLHPSKVILSGSFRNWD
jgi:hypothetical protein